ncbi:unnamed protein product [Agarophyton chilense]
MPVAHSLSARLFPSFAVLLQSRPEPSLTCPRLAQSKSISDTFPHFAGSSSLDSWSSEAAGQYINMAEQSSFGTVRPRVPSLPFVDRDSFSVRTVPQTLVSNMDSPLLSPYAQEQYALLEQVLRKDDTNGPNSSSITKVERTQDPIGSPFIGPEFYYFSDIMADAPSVSNNMLQASLKTTERLYANEADVSKVSIADAPIDLRSLDSAAAATDLSSGLESLCASNEPEPTTCAEQQQQNLLGVFNDRKTNERDDEHPVHSEAIGQFRSIFPFNSNPVSRSVFEPERETGNEEVEMKADEDETDDMLFSAKNEDSCEVRDQSPSSNISMTGPSIGSHPDLYENLSPFHQALVDALGRKIATMSRRKLRETLAERVTIEEVEPLMIINRDELAGMLGLGVTTWKMFVHNSLGVPRWPARALKSQKVKENKLLQRLKEAEARGDHENLTRLRKEHSRVIQNHMKRRKLFRAEAKQRSEKNAVRKKR